MTKRAFSLAGMAASVLGVCGLAITVAVAAVEAVPLPEVNPKRPPDLNVPNRNPSRAVATVAPAAVAPAVSTEPQTGSAQPAPEAQLAKAQPEAGRAAADPLGLSAPMLEPQAADKAAERRMAAALKPILAYPLSKSDVTNLKGTFREVYKRRFTQAHAARKRIKNEAARKLAEWYYLRSGGLDASAKRIQAFSDANPLWPDHKRLRRQAEYALFLKGGAPEEVQAFFAEKGPVGGSGKAALASALLKSGDTERAHALVKSAWRTDRLDKSLETKIPKRFKDVLDKADHKARVDALLYKDRRRLVAAAQRAAKRLSKAEQKKVAARAAVIRRSRSAGRLLDSLPKDAKEEVGVRFSRVQWLRRRTGKKRKGAHEKAWRLMLAAPTDPAVILDPKEWWIERRINARYALNAGEAQTAYDLTRNHSLDGSKYLVEAEFLSGFIALRRLKQPDKAKAHFEAARKAATWPKPIARAEYWLGRAEQDLGNAEQAAAHFRNAAQYHTVYYGQLARQTLDPANTALELAATPEPSQEDIDRFLARDAVRAIGAIKAAGLERIARLFFYQLARTLDSPGEVVLLAELARRMNMLQASVRLSKIAFNRGLAVGDYAFPTNVLPDYKRLNEGVEGALLHALSRQESEFNAAARSHAGARGMMQIMPRTARAIARKHKVRYRSASLTKSASYNVMLGAAHLRDLVDDYGGSYIMALCAYNAGGPRVEQWVESFGDPRHPDTDPIDWVEQIPFTETRNYVLKILESLQLYRVRLNGPEGALQLVQDLNRGKLTPRPETAAAETAEADTSEDEL